MIAFVLAFASVLFIAAISRFVAGYFTDDRASRIAGFSVALGYALGHFPGVRASTLEELTAVSATLGAVAGLFAAWAWLLRKSPGDLTDAEG